MVENKSTRNFWKGNVTKPVGNQTEGNETVGNEKARTGWKRNGTSPLETKRRETKRLETKKHETVGNETARNRWSRNGETVHTEVRYNPVYLKSRGQNLHRGADFFQLCILPLLLAAVSKTKHQAWDGRHPRKCHLTVVACYDNVGSIVNVDQ